MRQFHAIVTIIALGAAAAAIGGAASKPPSTADIDRATSALTDYEMGKSRLPLSRVEDLVKATAQRPELRQHLEARLAALLESNTTDECRHFVCKQLAAIGTDQSLPALRKMLTDEKSAHIACIACAGNPSEAASQMLREAAGAARGRALACIVGVIGDRRDGAGVPMLTKLAGGDDAMVAEAALAALGRIGTAPAAEALTSVSINKNVPANAVWLARIRCAGILSAAGERQSAAAIYRDLLRPTQPPLARRAALAGLLAMGGEEAAPLVISMLGEADRSLQATAIAQVRALQGEGITERFVEQLPQIAPALQAMLIAALADRGDPAARRAIAAAAGNADPAVRAAAIKALGGIGDASSVVLLVGAATGEDKPIAVASLRRLRGGDVDGAILRSMKSAAGEVRAALIEVLSDRGATPAVPAVLEEARGGDVVVRRAAFRALAQLAPAEMLPPILKIVVTLQDPALFGDAESAVVSVARREANQMTRSDAVIAALTAADSAATRCVLVRILRGIGNAKAFDAVRGCLADADAAVRDAAVRALADWPDDRAIGAVVEICRTTQNPTHRVMAIRGCIRMLALPRRTDLRMTLAWYSDLLRLAQRPEEKKLVLAGLALVSDARALALAEDCIAQEAIREEAGVAAVRIARALVSTDRDKAAASLRRIAGANVDEAIRRQARDILGLIDKLADHIMSWEVAGPYWEDGGNYSWLLGQKFAPDIRPGEVQWRRLAPFGNTDRPMVMDLSGLGGEQRIAYVRTWVYSEKAQDARLEMGIDDTAVVSLNGAVVHRKTAPGACIPGSEKANVSLKQGWNALEMKIAQNIGPWEFCARFRGRDGSALSGIYANAGHEAPESAADAKPVSLFDGRSFTGWEGPLNVFRIEDGAIVGGSLKQRVARNEFLSTSKEYSNFELRLEFKILGQDPNAGIQIRSRRIPNSNEMIGYQADLGQTYWGCLYDESRRNRVLARASWDELSKVLHRNDWNEYVIRCEGRRIQLWINGHQTVDYTEEDERIEQSGLIGLQIHGGAPSEAWYRKITIRVLTAQ